MLNKVSWNSDGHISTWTVLFLIIFKISKECRNFLSKYYSCLKDICELNPNPCSIWIQGLFLSGVLTSYEYSNKLLISRKLRSNIMQIKFYYLFTLQKQLFKEKIFLFFCVKQILNILDTFCLFYIEIIKQRRRGVTPPADIC